MLVQGSDGACLPQIATPPGFAARGIVYGCDGDSVTNVTDGLRWKADADRRRVAVTTATGPDGLDCVVSTVRLGGSPEALAAMDGAYETYVHPADPDDCRTWLCRYQTVQEAREGHRWACEAVRTLGAMMFPAYPDDDGDPAAG